MIMTMFMIMVMIIIAFVYLIHARQYTITFDKWEIAILYKQSCSDIFSIPNTTIQVNFKLKDEDDLDFDIKIAQLHGDDPNQCNL